MQPIEVTFRHYICSMKRIFIYVTLVLVSLNANQNHLKATKNKVTTNDTILKTRTMKNQDFTTTILVDQSPKEVFNAINNVRGWWSENIEGNTDRLNAEFLYHYKDVHICKMMIVEFVPNKKVVWYVLNNHFNFTTDKSEWIDTRIVFEISDKDGKTLLCFTHEGLVPQYECYQVCFDAWTSYIQGSLKNLITTGKGKPNTKEDDLNAELIEKWGLPKK